MHVLLRKILHFEHQTVVGIVEAFGKLLLFRGMKAYLMTHVYKICGDVAEAFAEGDGVFNGLVRLVRRVAQGSDNEQLDAFEQRQRGVEQLGHICQIGNVAYAIAEDGQFAVHNTKGCNFKRAELQAVALLYLMQIQSWNARVAVPYKAVGQALAKVTAGIVVGIKGKVVLEGKGAKVINATNMVVVLMRDEDSIERLLHLDAEHLFAEVGATVDKEPCVTLFK